MEKIDLEHWWNLTVAAGAIVAVIFFIAQLTHGFLFGIGLLMFGIGERINHREPRDIANSNISTSSAASASDYPEPSRIGLALDVVGIFVLGIGVLLSVFAP
jgi:hypothetical protein